MRSIIVHRQRRHDQMDIGARVGFRDCADGLRATFGPSRLKCRQVAGRGRRRVARAA